ncbi:MAG TPA: hypothetical protein VLA56_03870 [Pseudomonadales bacterium]|nr:hypothetical protein [Pseudomonadales bacterium]
MRDSLGAAPRRALRPLLLLLLMTGFATAADAAQAYLAPVPEGRVLPVEGT